MQKLSTTELDIQSACNEMLDCLLGKEKMVSSLMDKFANKIVTEQQIFYLFGDDVGKQLLDSFLKTGTIAIGETGLFLHKMIKANKNDYNCFLFFTKETMERFSFYTLPK